MPTIDVTLSADFDELDTITLLPTFIFNDDPAEDILERLTERHRALLSALVWHGQTASPR
ncbi:hypothetical protein [Methylobacterium sp. Leaf93]|uniref:hypothetical protein n=1 Tax=Methylobacterium sp. Leaf93 TaxID=1736249 RepID=UPI0012E94269|nr:hypothetical protein [Methylobacterium sp. Leaf93]